MENLKFSVNILKNMYNKYMKYLNFYIILILLFLTSFASAKQPKKTSNIDLRTNKVVLSITDHKGKGYFLLISTAKHYFLSKKDKKEEILKKLSNNEADLLDQKFVEDFIKLKYMMKNFQGKNCSKSFDLSMRGETYKTCKSEKEKDIKVKNLISLFENHFK